MGRREPGRPAGPSPSHPGPDGSDRDQRHPYLGWLCQSRDWRGRNPGCPGMEGNRGGPLGSAGSQYLLRSCFPRGSMVHPPQGVVFDSAPASGHELADDHCRAWGHGHRGMAGGSHRRLPVCRFSRIGILESGSCPACGPVPAQAGPGHGACAFGLRVRGDKGRSPGPGGCGGALPDPPRRTGSPRRPCGRRGGRDQRGLHHGGKPPGHEGPRCSALRGQHQRQCHTGGYLHPSGFGHRSGAHHPDGG